MKNNSLKNILGAILRIRKLGSVSYANPLSMNLEKIKVLEPKPFVSIHVAIYNEKRVVERLIGACTNQNWYTPISTDIGAYPRRADEHGYRRPSANYEVIIADDSTDETTEIAKKTLVGLGWQMRKESDKTTDKRLQTTDYGLQSTDGDPSTTDEKEIFVFSKVGAPSVKIIHRFTRNGFKGGALQNALEQTSPRAEYIVIFDADFVPYPDTIEQFVKTFQVLSQNDERKTTNAENENPAFSVKRSALSDKIAAVQGYQWHVLNKSANWVTRGVRTEYSGSYVIERSSEEIYGGLKQIAGSVYCIRADVLRQFGWGISITEDFELTLRLYEAGYKVVFSPYIQTPAEAVSTVKRLIRQRMRWAEGSSFNIKVMFARILKSPNMTRAEKLEFVYFAFYYLQAAFFIIGTFAWFISETVFMVRLPFWTAALGWSLVFTNLLALPLLNIVGLFLEESDERDYVGILSFLALSYIVVPFQAYAAIKGFLEKEEGPWFRTPKTGVVTDIVKRVGFFNFKWFGGGSSVIARPQSGEAISNEEEIATGSFNPRNDNMGLALAQISAYNPFSYGNKLRRKQSRVIGRVILGSFLVLVIAINYLAFFSKGEHRLVFNQVNFKVGEVNAQIAIPTIESDVVASILAVAPDPTIEQQINIIDQEFSTTSTSDAPGDNSLGIINYAGTGTSNYTAPTVYFEADIKNSAAANTTTVNLYDKTLAANVPSSTISSTALTYTRVRSGAITPVAGDDFSIGIRTSGGTAYVIAARLIIIQIHLTAIDDTQTHVEVGNAETTTATSMTNLVNPKYFQYDDSKYDGTKNAYFEATIKSDGTGNAGTFDTTSQGQLPQAIQIGSSEAVSIGSSTYVYVLGGQTGGASISTVFKATLNSTTGDMGVFDTASQGQLKVITQQTSAVSRSFGASTYLYVVGGNASTVYKSTINGTSGDAGIFDTTSQAQMPEGLGASAALTKAIGSSTYLYVLGGRFSGVTKSTLYRATFNSTTGDIGTFDTTSQVQLPIATRHPGASSATVGTSSYLYLVGGCSVGVCTTFHSTVYKSTINGTTGDVGTFDTASQAQLPQLLTHVGVLSTTVGSSTYLYVVGGCSSPSCTSLSTVYRSTINGTTGDVGTFDTTSQGQLSLKISQADQSMEVASVGSSTYLYVLGGFSTAGVSTVYKSAIGSNTVSAELYNRTDGTTVTESSVVSSAGVWQRVRSAALSTNWDTANADDYEVRFKTSAGTGSMANGKVVLTQTNTAGLTKFETYHEYINDSPISVADVGTFATTSQAQLLAAIESFGTVTSTVGSSTYVYVLGGVDLTPTTLSTVYKSTVNGTTGDLGAFATTSQAQLLAANEHGESITARVGASTYIYSLGGCSADTCTAGGTTKSTVYKSTINDTTGDLGAFATTSQGQLLVTLRYFSAPTATIGPSSYVYILGGNDGTSAYSTVYKSTVNGTTGDLGAFATTTQAQLLENSRNHKSATLTIGSSTYIYIMGGGGSGTSTVYKSTVNGTTGDLGAFATTSQGQLLENRARHGTVTSTVGSSTYLYVLGGCTTANCTTIRSTVYKSTVNGTTGDLGAFATTSQGQLIENLRHFGAVTGTIGSSTYLYVIGGCSAGDCTTMRSTVYKSSLNDFHNFGYWNLYNSENWVGGTFTYYHEATLKPVFTQLTGSARLTPGALGTVSGNGGNGNVAGTFATASQGQLPLTLFEAANFTSTAGPSTYVYVLGGCDAAANDCSNERSTVYKSTVNATTGDLGTFDTASQGQLPATRFSHSIANSRIGVSSYIYVLGGCPTESAGCATVSSTIYKSTINSTTGDLGAFATTSQAQLPALRFSQSSDTVTVGPSTYVYVLGGCNTETNDGCSNANSTVYKSTVNGTTGDLGAFATTTQAQLPALLFEHADLTSTVGTSTYVYVLGGCDTEANAGCASELSTVYKSTVNGTTGDLGAFATTTQAQLPVTLFSHSTLTSIVGSSTYVYVLGGCDTEAGDDCASELSTIYKSTLNGTTGDVGTFDTTSQTQLPVTLFSQGTVTSLIGSSTYLYVLGGCPTESTGCASVASTVYKSTLDAGHFERVRSGAITPVQTAGGNAGTFDTTSQGQLLQRLASSGSFSATVGSSSYLYVIGGCTDSITCAAGNVVSTVYKATFNSTTGDLGTFDTTNQAQFPGVFGRITNMVASAQIGSSTYLYVLGGFTGSGAFKSTLYRATLNGTTGDVGTFDTTSQAQTFGTKADAAVGISTIGSSTYLYVVGDLGTSAVYRGTINGTTGDAGTFGTTSQAQLPAGNATRHSITFATVGSSTYLYVIGGTVSSVAQSTIFRATLNGTTGDVGTFDTTSQSQLVEGLERLTVETKAIGSSTYTYVIGGCIAACSPSRTTVYKATLNSTTGDLGTFDTTAQKQLPATLTIATSVNQTFGSSTYIYAIGGNTATTVYKSNLSADGTEYDGEIQNASVNNNWLVINVAALSVPEWLLGFIPFGIFLPKLVKRLREKGMKRAV